MGVSIRHEIHYSVVAVLLHSPAGGVGRDMLRRGVRVQAQARRNLGGGGGRPKRVDTGLLRASIYVRPAVIGGEMGARVGTGVRYAMFVHSGTGIYGPRGGMIRPTRGRFLVFTPKGGGVVFARQVRGMRANPFLKDALIAARD